LSSLEPEEGKPGQSLTFDVKMNIAGYFLPGTSYREGWCARMGMFTRTKLVLVIVLRSLILSRCLELDCTCLAITRFCHIFLNVPVFSAMFLSLAPSLHKFGFDSLMAIFGDPQITNWLGEAPPAWLSGADHLGLPAFAVLTFLIFAPKAGPSIDYSPTPRTSEKSFTVLRLQMSE
jgi:hypothetical protein